MPCYWPRPAWQFGKGSLTFKRPDDHGRPGIREVSIPCGGCIGCRIRIARDWCIRCSLELSQHRDASWITLTYDDSSLVRPAPDLAATLYKPHLCAYFKRLRERVRSSSLRPRFFAVGEYGDRTQRPHYHAIVYGLDPVRHKRHLTGAWPHGLIDAQHVTPNNIAYTAGYAQKKIRPGPLRPREIVDPDTGEVFEWQESFRHVSRNPGIGGDLRRFHHSWRDHAVFRGKSVPVPRYLHESWKESATSGQRAALEEERKRLFRALDHVEALDRLMDGEVIAQAKYNLDTERRNKL